MVMAMTRSTESLARTQDVHGQAMVEHRSENIGCGWELGMMTDEAKFHDKHHGGIDNAATHTTRRRTTTTPRRRHAHNSNTLHSGYASMARRLEPRLDVGVLVS